MTDTFRIASEISEDRDDGLSRRWVSHPASTGADAFTVVEAILDTGRGHSFHKHPGQEEVIFVLAGRVEQWVEREKRVLGPGDAVFIPSGVVHASFNVADGESRLLAIFGPSVGDGFETIEVSGKAPWKGLRG